MASKNSIKVIPKFRSSTIAEFGALFPSGDVRIIARVEFPADGQLGDSVQTCNQIADLLVKRIRKSVP